MDENAEEIIKYCLKTVKPDLDIVVSDTQKLCEILECFIKEEQIKELSRALGLHDEDGKTVVKAWLDNEKDRTLSYLLTALRKAVPDIETEDFFMKFHIDKCIEKIKILQKKPKNVQIFNDPIHGSIKLNSLEQAIVNTPEFFRLKDIKQLGGAVHVYPGATHTRFEHSIGVCYIAGEYVRHFKNQLEDMYRPDPLERKKNVWEDKDKLKISWEDENCIRMAALCHDLGHGPFSHLFERMVKKKERPGFKKHEELSQLIFKKILLNHSAVLANFIKLGLRKEHVQTIEDMIDPKMDKIREAMKLEAQQASVHSETRLEQAAAKSKPHRVPVKIKGEWFLPLFLYEIVANKTSGVDVDKWDYFSRDCHYLGLTNEFDWRRCMELSEIVVDEGLKELHIGFRSKEVNNIYAMFRTRSVLHQKAYQHPVANGIEMMIKDILDEVQDEKLIRQCRKKPISWLEAVDKAFSDRADLSGYITLNDSILDRIMHIPLDQKEDSHAQRLVKEIMVRGEESYTCKGYEESYPVTEDERNIFRGKKAGMDKLPIDEKLMEIECVSITYASEKKTDPLMEIYFFDKNPTQHESGFNEAETYSKETIKGKVSKLNIPQVFIEYKLRLYSKTRKNKEEDLNVTFRMAKEYMERNYSYTSLLPSTCIV